MSSRPKRQGSGSKAAAPKRTKSNESENKKEETDNAENYLESQVDKTLHEDLKKQLAYVRKRRNFVAKDWVDKKTDLFNEYMKKCGLKGCVVSLSGGVDSALTLGLMVTASKKKGSPIEKVLAIAQPIHSTKSIQDRAYEVAEALGADIITVDQSKLHNQLSAIVEKEVKYEGKKFARGQLRSYMRTPVNFFVAQLLTEQGYPSVVMGTGNKDEDGYLLYFCKAGDGVVDVQLIADLHKSEVFKAAAYLGVPKSILVAPPSADLWEGQTDENELGFSYDFIELYTEYLGLPDKEKEEFRKACSEEAWKEFTAKGEAADKVHKRNSHKANFPHNINVL